MKKIIKFQTGELVTTARLAKSCEQEPKFNEQVLHSYMRYVKNDWGEMSVEDKQMNDDAVLNNNDRIFAAYETIKGKIYIITEADRSYTTILFANEY